MFKLRNQENGFAHVMLLAAMIVLVAVGGVGFYVIGNNKVKTLDKTAKNTPSSKAETQTANSNAVSEACENSLHDEDFCKFAGSWEGLTNYKMIIDTTNSEGSSTVTLEKEGTDKNRMTTSINGKESSVYVTIGSDSYIKDETDGSWTKFTSDTSKNSLSNIQDDLKVSDFDAAALAKNQYKKVGKESCGKLSCFKYQIIDSEKPSSENFIWFDTKDFLLRRITIKDSDTTSEVSMIYEKISISTPSPVK